jgi:hypothetical protein
MTPPEIFGRVQACPKRQASSDSCFPYGHCPRVGQSAEPGTATDQQRRLQSAPGASLRQQPLLAQSGRSLSAVCQTLACRTCFSTANLVECRGGSTSAAAQFGRCPARAETDQDQILDGPRVKGFRAWYRLSAPFGSLPASNFTAARFLSDSGDRSWPRKRLASKTMPGACSAVPEHEAIMPLNLPVSFTSTSSMPKTVGGPSACLLVVSTAVIRSSSTW